MLKIEDPKIQAVIDIITKQREEALDTVAVLAAQVKDLQQQIQTLKEKDKQS